MIADIPSDLWSMSEKYKFIDPAGAYFTTTTIVGWVDVFSRPELKQIVVSSLPPWRALAARTGAIPF
ncbi:MAG: hypothetical protein WDN75_15865 [Bacteroidota bacterium]